MKTMRRVIPMLLVLAMLFTTFCTAAFASDTVKLVTTGTAYLRSKADKGSTKLAVVPKGTVIESTKSKRDSRGVKWYCTKYDGERGWVSERNLEKYTETAKHSETRKIDFDSFCKSGTHMQVTSDVLKMRIGPSNDFETVETLSKGDIVYSVRSNGEWAEVEDTTRGRHGYMREEYLTEITPKIVRPNPFYGSVYDMTDGDIVVGFEPADAQKEDGVAMLKNVNVYIRDTYDIVDIAQLSVGDIIVIDGTEIVVSKLDKDGDVQINGGTSDGGYTLRAEDENNCFAVCGDDDAATYTLIGSRDFEISESVEYTDDADLDNHVKATYDNVIETINATEMSFTALNTTITVEDNKVVKISRIYTP